MNPNHIRVMILLWVLFALNGEGRPLYRNRDGTLNYTMTSSNSKSFSEELSLSQSLTTTATITPPPTATATATVSMSISMSRSYTSSLTSTITPPPTMTHTTTMTSSLSWSVSAWSVSSSFTGGTMSASVSGSPSITQTGSLTISKSPTRSGTRPPTRTPTLTHSLTRTLIPPPPPPCPTVLLLTKPDIVSTNAFRSVNVSVVLYLQGNAIWNPDQLGLISVLDPDTEGGFVAGNGFQNRIRPLLASFRFRFNNSKVIEATFPFNPAYDIRVPETVTFIIPWTVFRVLQFNCPSTVGMVTSFTIQPDDETPLRQELAVYGYVMGSASTAAVVASGSSFAADCQALALLSSMSCGFPADRDRGRTLKYFLSPFADYGEGVMLIGNLLLSGGILLLHLLVVKVIEIVTFVDLEAAMAKGRFPAISSTLIMFLQPGIAFVAFRGLLRLESTTGIRVMGFIGTLYVAAIPLLAVQLIFRRGEEMKFSPYSFPTLPILGPVGDWGPEPIRQQLGRLVQSVAEGRRYWSIYPIVLFSIAGVIAAANPESTALCQLQFGVLGTLFLAAGVVLFVFRPHRSLFGSLTSGLSLLLISTICWIRFVSFFFPSELETFDGLQAILQIIELGLLSLRVVGEMLALFLETIIWRPKQRLIDHPPKKVLQDDASKGVSLEAIEDRNAAERDHYYSPPPYEPIASVSPADRHLKDKLSDTVSVLIPLLGADTSVTHLPADDPFGKVIEEMPDVAEQSPHPLQRRTTLVFSEASNKLVPQPEPQKRLSRKKSKKPERRELTEADLPFLPPYFMTRDDGAANGSDTGGSRTRGAAVPGANGVLEVSPAHYLFTEDWEKDLPPVPIAPKPNTSINDPLADLL